MYLYELLYTEAPGEDQDEPGELNLILKVMRPIQNCFRSISEEIFDVSSQKHQGKVKAKFELGDLDQNFKVMKVMCVREFPTQYLENYLLHQSQT